MIYEYRCDGCNGSFDIVKPASEYNKDEHCPTSGTTMVRAVAPKRIFFHNSSVQEIRWQPHLGAAMTDREAKRTAKAQGLVEVGNDRPEKHLKVPETEYPSFSDDDIRALTAKP
jgi:putative FmdB family regulatory protein